MPIINIKMAKGRTLEQKRQLVKILHRKQQVFWMSNLNG